MSELPAAPRVTLGGNTFIDCDAIMAVNGTPVLTFQVAAGAPVLNLSLSAPPGTEAILIEQNAVRHGDASISTEGGSMTVRLREHILLRAKASGSSVAVEVFDLRPVGISVRADENVLHLGGATVANTIFRGNKIAIFLGPARAKDEGAAK